jgi:glycosyltransferase XagB
MGGSISARDGATWRQRLAMAAIGGTIGAAGALTLNPFSAAALVLSPLYLLHMLFSLGAAFEPPGPDIAPDTTSTGRDDGLKPYTILVALYDEAGVASQLAHTLADIDYPPDRLQVLFLTEADDAQTRAALARADLPEHFDVVVVPPGGPRTKPNALNHGLTLARGDYVTVFDAEDLPEPAQLRKASAAFAALPPEVACLQARLVIDNPADGWLSLMMAIEYAALFDATKCGFAAMAMPVALGGSSNHFRREALVRLGGWDAWNVTEDADLGLRIARSGQLVVDLPSATLEEAPFRLGGWFSQRRRWLKGFMQTLVSHSRAPLAGIRAMGLVNWLGGLTQITGAVLGSLLFPVFTVHILWLGFTGALFDNARTMDLVLNTAALWVAFCGVMAMLLPAVIGLRRRRAWHLSPWLITLPAYQLLVSVAAWAALLDYMRRPFHWLKTEHGHGVRGAAALRSRTGSR